MKRRSFFGGLAALFAAPAIAKEVIHYPENRTVAYSFTVEDPDDKLLFNEPEWVKITPRVGIPQGMNLSDAKKNFPLVDMSNLPIYTSKGEMLYRIEAHPLLNGNWIIPIADIANRPEDAKKIFEFVANTACEYSGVAYFDLNQETVIISGNCGTSKSSVLITPTSIRYRTITNRGQEIIHDAKTQKVVDFIRTLGYDFQ